MMANIAWSESLFLKNVLISDRNFVILCIGIMSLLVSYLKVTHFLRHTQVSNAFLHLYIHVFINFRNFNYIRNTNKKVIFEKRFTKMHKIEKSQTMPDFFKSAPLKQKYQRTDLPCYLLMVM